MISELTSDAYAVICQGGTTPIYGSTHQTCVLPADDRPSLDVVEEIPGLLIYHSVYSGGQNLLALQLEGTLSLRLSLTRKYTSLIFS